MPEPMNDLGHPIPMPGRQRRFVLVDPSFVAKDGDKWQYAVLFAKSAAANGYDFVLLTHRAAPSLGLIEGKAVDQRGIFSAAFFEHAEIVSRHAKAAADFAQRNPGIAGGKASAKSRRGAAAKPAEPQASTGDDCLPVDAAGVAAPFNRDDFALALAAELRTLDLGPGDHLFIHTMTYGMLESLCEITGALDLKDPIDVDAHFLFHFGAEASDARTFLDRYYQFSHVHSLVRRLRCGSPFKRMHFLATNPALQDEASRLLDVPVGLFAGLTDLAAYVEANGGMDATDRIRQRVHDAQVRRTLTLSIRASDLNAFDIDAVRAGVETLRRFNFDVTLQISFNAGTLPLLRDLARNLEDIRPTFLDASDNAEYIRQMTRSSLVLLTYDAQRYAKRVSAVLHDCSVLGVPAVVPAGSTLAEAGDYARIFVYERPADFAATLLYAARAIGRDPALSLAKAAVAREIYAADVVTRIVANAVLSLEIDRIGPIANLIMPLWGRVGSSHIIEAQIDYLLSRGYFVQQVFVLDKPVDKLESIPYFWRMLYENTRQTRGCVQRIAFPRLADEAEIAASARAEGLDGYQAFEAMIARGALEDPPFAARMRKAEVTIVNHVFHAGFAFAHSRKNRILESHDIQSYNLSRRPLTNPATGAPEPLSRLMASEMASVAKFDHVVSIVPEEDAVFSLFNPRTTLITPYIPKLEPTTRYKSVAELAAAVGLHESYQHVDRFDLLFVGDSHQNNVIAGRWLLEEVFKPFLLQSGCSLAICGRISERLFQEFEGLASVFFLGFVEDLASVYELSRLVLLPDRVGTGISIKALEALAAGKPVIATPSAVRGFHARLPSDFRTHKDADEFARAVLAGRRSDDQLRALTDLSRRSYAKIASREAVERGWDEVLRGVGIALPRAAPSPIDAIDGTAAAAPSGEPARAMDEPVAVPDPEAPAQRSKLPTPLRRLAGGPQPVVVRPSPSAIYALLSRQYGTDPGAWEACQALLRRLPVGADVIAATLSGSYLERRLRESVEPEHLFLHALPPQGQVRRRSAARDAAVTAPAIALGDRDCDIPALFAQPWPAAPAHEGIRIRTLDTLYAASHRPGLIVIEDAAAARPILAGAEELLRQAPMILISFAAAREQDRVVLLPACVAWLEGRGYDCRDGRLAPLASAARPIAPGSARDTGVICSLPPQPVQAGLDRGVLVQVPLDAGGGAA
jgi:glycosyltransferase involved in cell wall biosynthesis